jgi:hypothetical protein
MRRATWAVWALLCHSAFAYEVIMSKKPLSGEWQQLEDRLFVVEGSDVTLGCAVGSGFPTWKMCQWFYPNSAETGCTLFKDYDNQTCNFVNQDRNEDSCVITKRGIGEWMCKLNALTQEDNFGSVTVSLNPVKAPSRVDLNDTDVAGNVGSMVVLACSVSGLDLEPTPVLLWQLNGNTVANRTDACANTEECAYKSILEYTVAAADDGRDLTCSAHQMDSFGQPVVVTSEKLTIYVLDLQVSETLSTAEIVAIVLGVLLFLLLLLLLTCCISKKKKEEKEEPAYLYYTDPIQFDEVRRHFNPNPL